MRCGTGTPRSSVVAPWSSRNSQGVDLRSPCSKFYHPSLEAFFWSVGILLRSNAELSRARYQFSDFSRFPGLVYFSNIPDMLCKLLGEFGEAKARMRESPGIQ